MVLGRPQTISQEHWRSVLSSRRLYQRTIEARGETWQLDVATRKQLRLPPPKTIDEQSGTRMLKRASDIRSETIKLANYFEPHVPRQGGALGRTPGGFMPMKKYIIQSKACATGAYGTAGDVYTNSDKNPHNASAQVSDG